MDTSSPTFGFDTFLSPLTWRYGSPDMRAIWSEATKRRLLRRVWLALAAAQNKAGIVTDAQLADLRAHAADIDIPAALAVEAEIHHDLMAEIKVYAAQCPVGGPILHLGATSMDILDNADALRLRDALRLLRGRADALAAAIDAKAAQWAAVPCMAFTHLQAAEVTTVGYRLRQYAQDLHAARQKLAATADAIRGKGFKGAVGTMASYDLLLQGTGMSPLEMERLAMAELGLEAFPAATQVYPRTQDLDAMHALDFLAAALHKFAFDFRVMQSTAIGEWSEPFGARQVGSSAMPFKRNPVNCEKACSLARYAHSLCDTAWQNAADNLLERTLDDSANRRLYLPQAFLALDEALLTLARVVAGMAIHPVAIQRNLDAYGPFAATEKLLMALVRAGADRQLMHEAIRRDSLLAWEHLQDGRPNDLADILAADPAITAHLPPDAIPPLLAAPPPPGLAPTL